MNNARKTRNNFFFFFLLCLHFSIVLERAKINVCSYMSNVLPYMTCFNVNQNTLCKLILFLFFVKASLVLLNEDVRNSKYINHKNKNEILFIVCRYTYKFRKI